MKSFAPLQPRLKACPGQSPVISLFVEAASQLRVFTRLFSALASDRLGGCRASLTGGGRDGVLCPQAVCLHSLQPAFPRSMTPVEFHRSVQLLQRRGALSGREQRAAPVVERLSLVKRHVIAAVDF